MYEFLVMFIHAFAEGFKNILQEKRISITAIVIIYVSIMSICIIGSFWIFFSFGIRVLDKEIQVVAFIEKTVTKEQKDQLLIDAKNISGVKKVEYVNNNDGKNKILIQNTYKEAFKDNLERTNPNIANFDYIIVYPENSEKYAQVYNEINAPAFKLNRIYDKIPNMLEAVNALKMIYRGVQIVGAILITIFAIIAYMVMANIFQIMIYHHKNEIEIQRLVGATNSYIRSPFIAQGITYYLISSILVVLTLFPTLGYILPYLSSFINNLQSSNELINLTYNGASLILVIGFLFGIVTTYASIERYLKK
jgi:cell division transport system permease protein